MVIQEHKVNLLILINKDMVKLLKKHQKLKVLENGVWVVMVTNLTLNDNI